MNAIPLKENTCDTQTEYAMGNAMLSAIPDLDGAQRSSNQGGSNKPQQVGWGGPRANSGGPRPGFGGSQPGSGRPRKQQPTILVQEITGPYWIVVQSWPQAEREAARELTRAGYRIYLPLDVERRPDPVIRSLFRKVLAPMFRGYLFAEVSGDEWGPIKANFNNCFRGVRGVLMNSSGRPGVVETSLITALMDGDAARLDLAAETMTPFVAAAPVVVAEGAFAGQIGRVERCDGIKTVVALWILGREMPVTLDRASVRVAG